MNQVSQQYQISLQYQILIKRITSDYDSLSQRLKQVASFIIDHPTVVALEKIAVIAKRAHVPPSTLIRFAKVFDYSGFREMQQIFQKNLSIQSSNYKERINSIVTEKHKQSLGDADNLLQKFCNASIVSLEHLNSELDGNKLEKAANLLLNANNIYIIGQRRAYPIATYLVYSLNHTDCRAFLIDGSGGLIEEQAKTMRKGDVLIASSFYPYSQSTQLIAREATKKGIKFIAITDTLLSPITELASVSFNTIDHELHGFRSLTASLSLTQILIALVAYKQQSMVPVVA